MIFLAWRYLISRKRQTVLTLSGVMLGTSAFVIFAGIMTGFQEFIIDQLVNNDAHIKISVREQVLKEHALDREFFPDSDTVMWISPPSGRKDSARIDNPKEWIDRLSQDPRVLAYVPQYHSRVLISRGKITESALLIGTDVERQVRVSNIEKYVKEGSFKRIGSSGNRVIIGDGLLERIGARVGESILISSGQNAAIPFKIIGTFHFGIIDLDNSVGYAAMSDVQALARSPSVVSNIAVRLTDVEIARQVANDWQRLSNDKVQSWDEANAGILSVFSLQDFIRTFITASIMVVAAFGIYNILNILVNQKRKDIGILRSIGFTGNDIVHLFLFQGLTLGITGGLLGLAIGFLGSLYLTTLKISGMLDSLMINFNPKLYLSALLVAVAASVVSSVLPARAAGKLKPIEILRSGE